MDIISIVNTMQPNTISRLALTPGFLPDGIPFMGCFVELFPNATLPDPAAVTAYEATYNAMIAQQQADAKAKAALPDLATQVAQLAAAVAGNGIALPDAVIQAANTKLTAIGQPAIATISPSLQSVKLG